MESKYSFDVVAFGPHPDDVEISCGGLMIKLAKAGYTTGIVDLTRGELGTRGTVETRKLEAEAASKILGLKHRENLDLPDGGINPYDTAAGAQLTKVVSTIRKLRPEIILLPYHREGRHPDHSAGSALVARAVFLAGLDKFRAGEAERFTPRQVIYYQMRNQFDPSFLVDISEVAELKMKAIQAYATQFGTGIGTDAARADPTTLLSSGKVELAISGRQRFYGAMIGVDQAEAFYVFTALGIADPVSFFRANPTNLAVLEPDSI